MFNAFQALVGPAVTERSVLVLNHVLSSEPVATDRLRPHAGRCIRLDLPGWPSLLPPLPVLAFCITPAGLLEWRGADTPPPEPDLRVTVDASNPALLLAKGLAGQRPRIDVTGDALLATDVSWLFDNLRWDVQDDLARVVGPAPARGIAALGTLFADALRGVARVLADAGPSAR